ncbi:hypothetical protein [Consotaella aegiceratis]|uniref:hypothetical protein n=1 Tax=Consotaella aegiceratis TaxID=3097961 RepID=UPI002F41FD97
MTLAHVRAELVSKSSGAPYDETRSRFPISYGLAGLTFALCYSERVKLPGMSGFLGKIFYSLYLVHEPAQTLVRETTGFTDPWLLAAMATLASITLAYGLYRLVELPACDFSRRLARRSPPLLASF